MSAKRWRAATLGELIAINRLRATESNNMHGNEVRSVFEAAAYGALTLTDWHRKSLGNGFEELRLSGAVNATGKTFTMTSAPYVSGEVEATAAVLGKIARMQQTKSDQGNPMATIDLKIKGLTEAVTAARTGIAAVRTAASGVGQAATAFTQLAAQVEQQIKAAHADLEFEATSLGNAGPESSTLSGAQ